MENYIKTHDESKQISLTGARAIALIAGLMEGPKSFEEILKFIQDCGLTTKDYSIDTIRIDINTLKHIGFEITKAIKATNNKYGLISHPFHFRPTESEIIAIKTIYKKIARKASPEILYLYHNFFLKIADKMEDGELKEQVLGISALKNIKIDILEDLVKNEQKHNRIKILYQSSSNVSKEFDITLEKIAVRSNKLYAFCYNHTLKSRSFLNVSKIKAILRNMFDGDTPLGQDIVIKYKLTNQNEYVLEDNEIILEEHSDYIIVKGKYYNEFIAIQRILSFSPNCTVLEPDDMKQKIVEKLKEMRALYD